MVADKGYDSDKIREFIENSEAFAVIPPKKNRKHNIAYDKEIGRLRAAVENFFCRIKHYRRVNTPL
ncbi:MAG: transposase [Opitutales bacterium]|nr:transposase [Opitutales bacterium]